MPRWRRQGGLQVHLFLPHATPTATETETPTPTSTETLIATPTLTATACPVLSEQEKYAAILDLYFKKIPVGIGNSGPKVNVADGMTGKIRKFVCGGYQSQILDFLNKLKFSDNPCERVLLDKWDYGPIQAWWGFHQAVVLYPFATNWMETGTVLDPWIEQKPQIYEISNWAIDFSGHAFAPFIESAYTKEERSGASFRGIGPSKTYTIAGNYPMYGNPYSVAGNELTLSPAENAYIKTLPEEKKKQFNKMSLITQKEYLQMKLAGVEKVNKVVADCPLKLYLVNAEGARSGISGDKVYDQLPNVTFMALPLEDGTIVTEMLYPQGAGYTLVFEGMGEGKGEVLIGETLTLEGEPDSLQKYSFEVDENMVYQVSTDKLGAPLQWNGGTLQPETITEISEEWLNSLPDLAVPEVAGGGYQPASGGGSIFTRLAGWKPALPGVIFLFVVGTAGLVLFAVLLIMKMVKKNKAPGVPHKLSPILQWILLIGLFLVSCELSSMAGIGLINNLKQPADAPQVAVPETAPAAYLVVTATSQVVPSSTPAPSQTMTAEMTSTATETPGPTSSGTVLTGEQFRDDHGLVDDFSSKALGWPEIDDGRKILKYEDGGYSFQLFEKDSFDTVYLPVTFNPSEIGFGVRAVEGYQDGTVGVFCHLQDQLNYYYVEFDLLTSSYVIAQSLDGEYIPLTTQAADGTYWHESAALKAANSVNHINISCYLDTIFVMANTEVVDEVFIEKPFTKKGKAALFVYTYDFAGDEGYKVIFDNVEAYEPVQ